MQLADVSNLSEEQISAQTELLAQIYLDPVQSLRPFFWIGIYEKRSDRASRLCYRGPIPPCHEFAFGKGNVGSTAESGIQKVIPDVTQDATYSQCFIETASEVVQPIYFLDQLVGVIDVEDDKKNAFSASDLKLIEDLSHQVAPLIAWSEASWSARLKLMRILQNLAREHPEFNWVGLYRRSPQNPQLLWVGPYVGDPTPHVQIPLDQGVCGAAIREETLMNVPDVKQDPRYLSCSVLTKSELVVPLRNPQGEIVAELDIDCRELHGFPEAKERKMKEICSQIEQIPGLF